MAAKTYEFSHPDGGRFQFWSGDHEVVVETGSPYTTSNPDEQKMLDECPDVTEAKKKESK